MKWLQSSQLILPLWIQLFRPDFYSIQRRHPRNAVTSLATSVVPDNSTSMDRVKTPDRARFQALCQSLRPDLARFAFWLCQDRAVAEDVVQESMLRAWSAKASLQDEKVAKPCDSPLQAHPARG
jgi:hypothetical protein